MGTVAVRSDYNPNNHKAQRFTARLAIVALSMSFAGLTSYYIVRKSKGDFAAFEMPVTFWISTAILVLSSVALYMAHRANRNEQMATTKYGVGMTFLLGSAFCVTQWIGWQQLLDAGVFLSGGNVSGSIFYVITGAHFVHVLGGLLFLLIATFRSFWMFDRQNIQSTYQDKVNDKLHIRTDLLSVYWHFMGILWIYLFLFLYINH